MTPTCLPLQAEVSSPQHALPEGACDCHFHVFEPAPEREGEAGSLAFPLAKPRSYTPTPAPLAAYRAIAATLGLQRGVLVHPSVFGRDHTSFEHLLATCGGWMRGVAVAFSDTPLADIERWHALGARGTRFNALFDGGTDARDLPKIVDRVRAFGWHLQVLMDVSLDPHHVLQLAELGLPLVVDHFGHVPAGQALHDPGFANLLALVREGRAWVKLSAPYRLSGAHPHYTDLRPLVDALLQANPKRLVWGTDWPHPASPFPVPDDEALMARVFDWLPDAALRQQVLVDNATALYWQDTPPR